MKSLANRRLGEHILGQICECLNNDDYIVAFDGDLLRVHNETQEKWQVGDQVNLLVVSLTPLRFRMSRGLGHKLDVSI